MSLRQLPSVESLLQSSADLIAEFGRPLVLNGLRAALDSARAAARSGESIPTPDQLLQSTRADLSARTAATLRPVINATGVIIHTNLGRSLLSDDAVAAIKAAAQQYSTLEYDLDKGARGSRGVHAESLLAQITGAESALVVNNAAAAVLLALTALAKGKEVIVSRGQLVEIGGGFRVPDVMKQSGAKLIEVGTTNRTHARDYAEAITAKSAALLRAHHSNFKIVGFTTEPTLGEIVAVAHEHNLPVIDDLGSGALLDTAAFGLAHEPTVQESVGDGASLAIFSGDKLLGGPQAGIIVGERALIEKLKKHPLARAVRADKFCLAALSATLLHYLKDEATVKIPVWRMISMPITEIESRARRWAEAWGGEVVDGQSTIGGGSLPGETLPAKLAALRPPARSPNKFLAELRAAPTPVIARVAGDRVVFDPRTVSKSEEAELIESVITAHRAYSHSPL
ncbi:MAG: L-seryl-tRNA(Sec) selenium transferase [Chloroflexota bacterium]